MVVAWPVVAWLPAAVGPGLDGRLEDGCRRRRSARYDSSDRIIFSSPAMLFSNPPERWSPRAENASGTHQSRGASWGISRLTRATFSSATLKSALRFAQRLFLVGVGNGFAPLLRELAAVKVGPGLHQVFRPLLDLRLPVTELVALEPVAHPAQLHVNPAE